VIASNDPGHPSYLDEADVRHELARVAAVCHGCQRCLGLCSSFPTLFGLIDRFDDRDPGRMTPAEQDEVLDECFQCKLCAVGCPYSPELDERAIDVPRLVLRAAAMRHATGQQPARARLATQTMAPSGSLGRMASAAPRVANSLIGASRGSVIRKAVSALTGVSAVRLLPPYARQRFSTWFTSRSSGLADTPQRRVTLLATCFVEYHDPSIGRDLVAVYEHNRIACSLSRAGCCGAPWLHAGDVDRFVELARRNVSALAAEISGGHDVVVAEPTCSYVLKHDYVHYVGGPDAELVAANTYDSAEYLVRLRSGAGTTFDAHFAGDVPDRITYHAACHLRAQQVAGTGSDLLALTGAEVTVIEQCAGIDGVWGLRAGNDERAIPMARALGERIEAAGTGPVTAVVAGDCGLANTAIAEQTGLTPSHPMSVLARAYGIGGALRAIR
jgi:glycerol-3-phosphate dehydrogenase subunit C